MAAVRPAEMNRPTTTSSGPCARMADERADGHGHDDQPDRQATLRGQDRRGDDDRLGRDHRRQHVSAGRERDDEVVTGLPVTACVSQSNIPFQVPGRRRHPPGDGQPTGGVP